MQERKKKNFPNALKNISNKDEKDKKKGKKKLEDYLKLKFNLNLMTVIHFNHYQ